MTKMLCYVRDARVMGDLPRRANDLVQNQPQRERGMLQSTKPGGADNLKSALTSSIEMQTLEFFTLFFSPALV